MISRDVVMEIGERVHADREAWLNTIPLGETCDDCEGSGYAFSGGKCVACRGKGLKPDPVEGHAP